MRRSHTNDIGWAKHNERLRKEALYKKESYIQNNKKKGKKSSGFLNFLGMIFFTILGGIAGGPAGALLALGIVVFLTIIHSIVAE